MLVNNTLNDHNTSNFSILLPPPIDFIERVFQNILYHELWQLEDVTQFGTNGQTPHDPQP